MSRQSPRSLGASLLSLLLGASVLGAHGGALAVDRPVAQERVAEDRVAQERVAEDRLDAEELEWLELDFRRGKLRQVLGDIEEILEEFPDDFRLVALRARVRFERCEYERALKDAREALAAARKSELATPPELAAAARSGAQLFADLGRYGEALAMLDAAGAALRPDLDPRDAWVLGSSLLGAGRRSEAFEAFDEGSRSAAVETWDAYLAQARCLHIRGDIRAAAQTLVAADKLAQSGLGVEPDVLVALGEVYFEAYSEVNDALARAHSSADLYREALRLHPTHEGARLGLFELYRFNWRRSRYSPTELLTEVLGRRPLSARGLLARVSSAIDNGNLPAAREALDRLLEFAPGLRMVRIETAALAWVERGESDALELIAELVALDPGDSTPERKVGRHLLELYRFREGLSLLEKAVERNPRDWLAWTQLGRAQANTGDEDAARASLTRAVEIAEGRLDAWRDNTLLVLRRMVDTMVERKGSELSFAWLPDAAPVLERYLVPFYEEAREELAQRYGFTPAPTKIEVFRKWEDFSVRSTGFQGFPALGVCFGPVVTAVSPLSELRGGFSWARTSYHEFTHVIHLGLSHNRCPRWVTEGLATWEEGVRTKSWWRNLRREMLDAKANGTIIPTRRLNAAFRGPRVIFAYFQSGLLCKMLIEEHGFQPMVRLLEAFDRGADLDSALEQVYQVTPEELEQSFEQFVEGELSGLAIEPRWSRELTFQLRYRLERTPPEESADAGALGEWIDSWCRVAWGSYWAGDLVDAKEALRIAATGGELSGRGHFLRGELFIREREFRAGKAELQQGFDLGAEDFRARMALASLLIQEEELEEAEHHLLAAEAAFPGYDDPVFNAELKLAELYDDQGRADEAFEARLRWLSWNAGNFDVHVDVATWLDAEERFEESVQLWQAANEVDPFRRHLHLAWGKALRALGRHEEALREFEVGLLVPAALDGDLTRGAGHPGLAQLPAAEQDPLTGSDGSDRGEGAGAGPLDPRAADGSIPPAWTAKGAQLEGFAALTLIELGREAEARAAVERALAVDADCAPALEARERLP